MANSIVVLGISGSLRQESFNTRLLAAAARLVPRGMHIETYVPREVPLFNQDTEQQPTAAVTELKKRIRDADAVLFSTPEYNYSIPGVLKNCIDAASRPYGDSAWKGKPCAVMGASVGKSGTIRAQNHLRQMLVYLDMPAVLQPEVLVSNAGEAFDASGKLADADLEKRIRQMLDELAKLVTMLRGGTQYSAAA
jgi:chromate reductase